MPVLIIAFGATALTLALAFGLGGRDAAAEYLKKWLGGEPPLPSSQKLYELFEEA